MAVRALQLSVVFTIGFYLGPVAPSTVATNVTDKPIDLSLRLEDPQDVVVAKGQSAQLRCKAHSTKGRVHFTWYYNEEPIPPNSTLYSQRQEGGTSTLYIPAVARKRYKTNLEGKYRCLANNSIGAVLSGAAGVTVASFARNFSEHPTSTVVYEQQPTVLRCQIHSIPKAVIQWELNDKLLPHNSRFVPLSSGVLLIASTHSSDTGLYRCVAKNDILNKTRYSNYANLTVLSEESTQRPPQFLPLFRSENTTVLVGQNLALYCPVSGWPIPDIRWKNENNVVIRNASALILHNAKPSDAGNYTCSVSNSLGQTEKKYSVEVLQKPYFTVTPTSKLYPPAKTVRLDCHAEGIPLPNVTWLKNGVPLMPKENVKITPSGLVISHSFTTDSGIYQCVATNSVGSIWKAAQLVSTITTPFPPPENVSCRPFDDSSICLTWSSPRDIDVKAYTVHYFLGDKNNDLVTNVTHMLTTGLQRDTNYTFFVRMYSNVASDHSKRVWCKTGETGKRNLTIHQMNNSSVQLTWEAISSDVPCGKFFGRYKVQWRKIGQQFSNVDHIEGLSHLIRGLHPSSTYEFKVTSLSNPNDNSSWITYTTSSIESYNTTADENRSPNVPENLEVQILSPTSLNLTWSQRNDDKAYDICFVEMRNALRCEDGHIMKSVNGFIELKNLKPAGCYEMKVRARSTSGSLGDFSHGLEVCMTTDGRVLKFFLQILMITGGNLSVPAPAVEILHYVNINSTAACLNWRLPERSGAKIIGYVIRYSSNTNQPLDKWQTVELDKYSITGTDACTSDEPNSISAVLPNLSPNLNYTITIRAKTDVGLGKPSIYVTKHKNAGETYSTDDDLHQKQKLGVILGLTLALICIACCVVMLFFRRRCVKRRALTRARLAASNNYYQTPLHTQQAQETSLTVQLEDPCVTQAHELQQLMSVEGGTQITPVNVTHLDTKGGATFPNGQLNGSAKFLKNGFVPNGHVHITENPQYNDEEPIELVTSTPNHKLSPKPPPRTQTYEEDSNSNLRNPKLHDLEHLFMSKEHAKPLSMRFADADRQVSSGSESSLNCTRLTYLDDSLMANHRTVGPVLGPNG